jgi:uncharacterized damage-inducible protein DinB
MSTQAQPDLRYPVGKFAMPQSVSAAERGTFVENVSATPARLRAAVAGLTGEQLDTPYRPGGWTVRQVVHHVPDSHLNSYIRFKLALTEDTPTIKTYRENLWAELADSSLDTEVSLRLLECVHTRWVTLLRAMTAEQFARPLRHPEMGPMTLDQLLALYNWHGKHHVAHITSLRERMGW